MACSRVFEDQLNIPDKYNYCPGEFAKDKSCHHRRDGDPLSPLAWAIEKAADGNLKNIDELGKDSMKLWLPSQNLLKGTTG